MPSRSLAVPPDQRDLVVALAALTLERSAPEELAVLEATATEYFEDPTALLTPERRDEPLGVGLDVALLAPYALAVAADAVQVVLGAARPPAASTVGPASGTAPPRAVGARPEAPPPIDPETTRRLRQVALERGTALGLDLGRAALLADSLVAALTPPL